MSCTNKAQNRTRKQSNTDKKCFFEPVIFDEFFFDFPEEEESISEKRKENDEINSMSFGKKIASAYSDYSRNLPKRDISRAIIKNIPTNTASSGNDFDVIISSIECIQNSLGKVRTQLERIADS